MAMGPHRRTRVAAILLAALALGACKRGGGAGEKQPAPEPITLAPENVATVTEQTLQAGPDISGTLRAKRAAALRAEVGGTVLEVLAEAGERVRPGQALARIDDTTLRDALIAARSGVVAAKNAVAGRGGEREARADARRGGRVRAAAGGAGRGRRSRERGRSSPTRGRGSSRPSSRWARRGCGRRSRASSPSGRSRRATSSRPGAPLFTVIDPARLQFEASVPAAQVGAREAGRARGLHRDRLRAGVRGRDRAGEPRGRPRHRAGARLRRREERRRPAHLRAVRAGPRRGGERHRSRRAGLARWTTRASRRR